MADSDNNRLATENPSQDQDQEQSTLDWLYNTVVSFLPGYSTEPSATQQQQQPTSGPCEKTAAPVCRCNKNKPK